jgi:hypothetical protein
MFVLKSSAAAHAFVDIVRYCLGHPHLPDVVEANAPVARGSGCAVERHIERTLEAAEVIAAACQEQPRKGMPVPIDIRDLAIESALLAMLDLYLQFEALGDTGGYGADALDVAEIRMTIQAALDQADSAAAATCTRDLAAPCASKPASVPDPLPAA